MAGSTVLRVEQHGPVRWLHLSRPAKRNALNGELALALSDQVASAEADEGTAVVVIAGDGPSFSAGGDFQYFLQSDETGDVVEFLATLSECLDRIDSSSKVWVASLHGHAIAGGLELALVCDIVVAAEGTAIGDGHLNNQLLPGAGSSIRLERAVGKSMSRWMHLTGESVSAEALAATGWIHKVVPAAELRDETHRIARRLALPHAATQQRMKRLLVETWRMTAAEGLVRELDVFRENWELEDVAGALRAFLHARAARSEQEEVSP